MCDLLGGCSWLLAGRRWRAAPDEGARTETKGVSFASGICPSP
ncbi:unnamed protein product [Ciceribacter selenitireducens ATCC BAA-1503]|uniref:Uncharacterized protein n=1 Tax=Ciceribacter selenitireducens ATCC BAA-1503 TaxID=1336235 RepID=A0A376AHD9_9HYPH|nr:unnamed protein product [Ciceribacter selenitireducens ATCC BAA-1503]